MIELGLALAGIFGGLTWLIRDLPGVLASGRTGTIRSKSFGAPLIRRQDDAERFDRLVAYRRKRLIWPTLMLIGGFAMLALWLLAISHNMRTYGHP